MTAKVELLTPLGGKVILDPTDTAVDRTLTLPAVAGTVFNQGNVVGTVSQSSGVPTGAIIERGSNANGEYVKFADGTMICRIAGSFNAGATGNRQYTYPATFTSSNVTITYAGENNAGLGVALADSWATVGTTSSGGLRNLTAGSGTYTLAITVFGSWF